MNRVSANIKRNTNLNKVKIYEKAALRRQKLNQTNSKNAQI